MNLREKKLNNNIWKLYLLNTLQGMFFSVPIIVLFWQDNGLSLTDVMVLQAIFAFLVALLEIPTGYFADVFERRLSLILAAIVGAIAISVYSIGHNFAHFLIAEIFFAFASSFVSGAKSAFLYDTLQDLGKEKLYKKLWGKVHFYGMISMAASGIIGGFIATVDLRYTLYASIPFFALMIPVAFSLQEPERHKLIFKKGYLKELFEIIKVIFIKNQKLKWIIIYSAVIYAFSQSALWLYQPYFKLSGIDIVYFGIVFASFQIIAALSSKYAYKLEEKLGQKYSLIILIFLISVSYLLMSNFVFLFSFSFAFIQQFVRGFKNTIISDYINQMINSDVRATVLSAENFIGKMLYAIIMPLIGLFADVYTIEQTFLIMGVITFMFGLSIIFILRRYKAL